MKYVALLSLVLVGCGFEIVDTGHRGVKTTFGKVSSSSLEEGLYFYNPMTSSIHEMEVRVLKGEGEAETYTKDVQQSKIRYVVNYQLDSMHVHDVFRLFGPDWANRLLPQVVEASLKSVVGKWDAVDLVSNRLKATQEAQDIMQKSLEDKFIKIVKLEITNIDYADEFEHAVEAKVVAIQRATEAENKTRQIQEEAKQKVIDAKAVAESMEIRARALTQNKNLVEYEAVQKWNGVLPQYSLSGAIPFISVGK